MELLSNLIQIAALAIAALYLVMAIRYLMSHLALVQSMATTRRYRIAQSWNVEQKTFRTWKKKAIRY